MVNNNKQSSKQSSTQIERHITFKVQARKPPSLVVVLSNVYTLNMKLNHFSSSYYEDQLKTISVSFHVSLTVWL